MGARLLIGAAVDQRLPAVGRPRSRAIRIEVDFLAPFGTQEPGYLARLHLERQVAGGRDGAITVGQHFTLKISVAPWYAHGLGHGCLAIGHLASWPRPTGSYLATFAYRSCCRQREVGGS
jgi:hypothetical protein